MTKASTHRWCVHYLLVSTLYSSTFGAISFCDAITFTDIKHFMWNEESTGLIMAHCLTTMSEKQESATLDVSQTTIAPDKEPEAS